MLGQISLFVAGFGLGGGLFGYLAHVFHKRAEVTLAAQVAGERVALQEEVVHQKAAAFETLFGTFSGGAAVLDEQGHIVQFNASLHKRLGYSAEELRGRSLLTIVHPEDGDAIRDYLSDIASGRNHSSFSQELRYYSKTGKVVWVQLTLSVMDNADLSSEGSTRLLAFMDDVTRLRQAEGVVARLNYGVNDLYRIVADHRLSFEEQMNALLDLGCHLFDVRTGILGRLNGNQLDIKACVSPNKGLRVGGAYEIGSPSRRVELPALLCQTHLSHWRDYPFVTETEDETFLGAPVYVAGQLAGVLSFSDTASRPTPFEAEQTQFCQLMALWIGSEIERRERQAQKERTHSDLLQTNAKLEAMATQDGLTGLKNRRAFDERLDVEFKRASQRGVPLSLMLMDVDKFKGFNDNFGHPAGDEVLKKVAQLLQGGVRAGGFVARYGGEEFVVLLPNTGLTDALVTAERLRASIEAAHWQHRAVTISIGVANWAPEITAPAQLLSSADGALYESKEAGRNRVTQALSAMVASSP